MPSACNGAPRADPISISIRISNRRDRTAAHRRVDGVPIRIGRNPLNTLQLKFPFVSQFHVEIDRCDRGLLLRDLGSKNGTYFGDGLRVPSGSTVPLGRDPPQFLIGPLAFDVTRLAGGEALTSAETILGEPLGDDVALATREEPLPKEDVPCDRSPLEEAFLVATAALARLLAAFGLTEPVPLCGVPVEVLSTRLSDRPAWLTDPAALAHGLVGWGRDGSEALKEAVRSVLYQQFAAHGGAVRGLRALLHDLSPAVADEDLRRSNSRARSSPPTSRERHCPRCEMLRARHAAFAQDDEETLGGSLGPLFVAAYRNLTAEVFDDMAARRWGGPRSDAHAARRLEVRPQAHGGDRARAPVAPR
jgi:hypothetical protein